MSSIIISLILYILAIVIGIQTMIHGWGLTPVSWGWVIGAGIFGQFMIIILQALTKE